jgi:serine/threonine protein kinase
LEILLMTINISRVLVTMKDEFPTVAYPLAKKMKLGHSEIAFNSDHVEKRVASSHLPYSQTDFHGRLNFLRGMYEHAKDHRGLVKAKDGSRLSENGRQYVVTLETRGITFRPRTEDELRRMTRDLVSGLACLHSGDYLHRDIRSPNVLYNPATGEYFLIDFEHGAREGQEIVDDDGSWLKEWDEGTLDHGRYTKMSDLYQLEKLLRKEFGGMILSQDGNGFLTILKAKMTAQELPEHVLD